MNNRWYKKLLLLLTVGCMTVSMTGCSADSVLDKLLSVTDPKPGIKRQRQRKRTAVIKKTVQVKKK